MEYIEETINASELTDFYVDKVISVFGYAWKSIEDIPEYKTPLTFLGSQRSSSDWILEHNRKVVYVTGLPFPTGLAAIETIVVLCIVKKDDQGGYYLIGLEVEDTRWEPDTLIPEPLPGETRWYGLVPMISLTVVSPDFIFFSFRVINPENISKSLMVEGSLWVDLNIWDAKDLSQPLWSRSANEVFSKAVYTLGWNTYEIRNFYIFWNGLDNNGLTVPSDKPLVAQAFMKPIWKEGDFKLREQEYYLSSRYINFNKSGKEIAPPISITTTTPPKEKIDWRKWLPLLTISYTILKGK